MANSRLTVNISRELVFSIAVIGNEKLQSAYLLEMMPWNHSLNTPLSSCTTPFGAWVSLNHWTALWNMIACQSLALIRDWSMSTARVPYQHIRQSDHLFWDKRSHPPESACVRDILGRSYNKELQRFSLPSPQVSLLRAAHASRSRDTKKTELEDTREKNTYAKDTENIDIRCFIFFSSKRILVWIRLSYKYVFFILQIIWKLVNKLQQERISKTKAKNSYIWLKT